VAYEYKDSEDFYYNELTKNPENKIIINSRASITEPISGFIDSSHTFQASSQYDPGLLGSDTGGSIASMGKPMMSSIGSAKTLKTFRDTVVTWASSSLAAVGIEVIIMANKEGDNVMKEGKKIWNYVLPGKWGPSGSLMVTPGEYSTDIMGIQKNGVSLKIGSWFEAYNAFVVTTASVEYSKTRVRGTNQPLWCKISITLSPNREFDAEKVMSWFKDQAV